MEIERLFNYRPDGKIIQTNNGEEKIIVIRKGPRGIVSVILNMGPSVLWSNTDVEIHLNDTEDELIQRTIQILNS